MGWLHSLSARAVLLLVATCDRVTQVHPPVTSHILHTRSVTHGNQLSARECLLTYRMNSGMSRVGPTDID